MKRKNYQKGFFLWHELQVRAIGRRIYQRAYKVLEG